MGYIFPYKKILKSANRISTQLNQKFLLALGYNFPYKKVLYMLNSHKPSQQIYQRFPHRANYFFETNEPPKAKNLTMDLSKLNINTLDGSNWAMWSVQVQSTARILNCWDVHKGRSGGPFTTPPTYSLLTRPMAQTQTNAALLAEELASWNKKNSTALGVIHTRKNELGNLA